MVKVIELMADERARKERNSKLQKIAQEIIPKGLGINPVGNSFVIGALLPERILVTPYENEIRVNQEEGFDLAMQLAKEYEARGEPEFTIKKDY